jgi:hypothetical protein
MNGSGLMGFGKGEEPPRLNRAQRRHIEKHQKRQQRRGQRAYERSLREGNGPRVAKREGDVAAFGEGS